MFKFVMFMVWPPIFIFVGVSIFGVEAFISLYTSQGAKPPRGTWTLQELGTVGGDGVGADVGAGVGADVGTIVQQLGISFTVHPPATQHLISSLLGFATQPLGQL